ncbi:hypothetical protein, partial [Thauera propionica]|uniref:hypothetical protein n=1 Tax=Thauera propionica TaxID=2019431 RepID=UPI0023F4782B
KTTPNIASRMTGKRKGIGLFGDCQSTNLRTVNHYFPQIARRTENKAVLAYCGPALSCQPKRPVM